MVDYDKEIIELLNKLSSEMCSKIDGIHFEINSMKSAISTLNNKIEKNSKNIDMLSKNINELYEYKESITNTLESKNDIGMLPSIFTNFNDKLNNLNEVISNTSESIFNSNTSTYSKLDSLNQDLRFLTHKIIQSEKDLFTIQENLKSIIKNNTK